MLIKEGLVVLEINACGNLELSVDVSSGNLHFQESVKVVCFSFGYGAAAGKMRHEKHEDREKAGHESV